MIAFSGPERESARTIERDALAWAARSDRGRLSALDEADLKSWMAQDTRRAGAFARAMAANAYFDRTAALGEHYAPPRQSFVESIGRRRLLATVGIGALATSVAGLIGVRSFMSPTRIATARGDVRRIALAEGSAVTLNTDTEIAPSIGHEIRRVDLLHGEALFDVTKDAQRPFIVFAGKVQVRAVGTSFTVRLHNDDTVAVAVREGIVEVTRYAQPPVRLGVGHRTLSGRGSVPVVLPVSQQEMERTMAWRDGRLDLTGLTLGEAAAEFARYSDRRIIVADPALAGHKVAGVYSTSDPAGFARAAALGLGLAVSEDPQTISIHN